MIFLLLRHSFITFLAKQYSADGSIITIPRPDRGMKWIDTLKNNMTQARLPCKYFNKTDPESKQ